MHIGVKSGKNFRKLFVSRFEILFVKLNGFGLLDLLGLLGTILDILDLFEYSGLFG